MSKTVRLHGVFLEVIDGRVRWSLTGEDGFTSYGEGRLSGRGPTVEVGDRFTVHLEMDERGDVLASRWEAVSPCPAA